jgi:signal transduction histidine kinase
VENAVKYNKDCGEILIETKADNDIGQIIITDTGNGIPAEELEQIFEPFYCKQISFEKRGWSWAGVIHC